MSYCDSYLVRQDRLASFAVVNQFCALLPCVVNLGILWVERDCQLESEGMGDTQWLLLLHPFTTVQALRVSFSGHCACTKLEEVTGAMVAGQLPALDLLCLEYHRSSVEIFMLFAGTLTAL